jgi:DNA-binding transcriptional MocR family regulator
MLLWIELPRHVDSREVFALARLEHIGVAPGAAFSIGRRFDHYIRLQYGQPWSPQMEAAIRRLGQIVSRLADEGLSRESQAVTLTGTRGASAHISS